MEKRCDKVTFGADCGAKILSLSQIILTAMDIPVVTVIIRCGHHGTTFRSFMAIIIIGKQLLALTPLPL